MGGSGGTDANVQTRGLQARPAGKCSDCGETHLRPAGHRKCVCAHIKDKANKIPEPLVKGVKRIPEFVVLFWRLSFKFSVISKDIIFKNHTNPINCSAGGDLAHCSA